MKIAQLLIPLLLSASLLAVTLPSSSEAQPITADSRIKTFVYNPNEVFTVTTHYGYQSNIEFGPKESIETISVGDRVAWQIIPAGRRLFIRAMEENAHTNMTIVTNLRAYQFDLRSSAADAVFGSEELTYVVRFYYPQDPNNNALPLASTPVYVPPPSVTSMASPAPTPAPMPAPAPVVPHPTAIAPVKTSLNYHYTFSGPSDIAPTKIYDDGKTTYFKLPAGDMPKFSIVTAKGETVDVSTRRTSEGLIAVDAVAPRFALNEAGRQIIVYNEAGGEVH